MADLGQKSRIPPRIAFCPLKTMYHHIYKDCNGSSHKLLVCTMNRKCRVAWKRFKRRNSTLHFWSGSSNFILTYGQLLASHILNFTQCEISTSSSLIYLLGFWIQSGLYCGYYFSWKDPVAVHNTLENVHNHRTLLLLVLKQQRLLLLLVFGRFKIEDAFR